MKMIKQFLISIFLVALLINNAYGYPGWAANKSNSTVNSTVNSTIQQNQNDTTQSDQDIQLLQHLIEVDTVQLQSEDKIFAKETLIFKNSGLKNFSGTLRTWVPDGAEGMKIERRSMVDGSLEYTLQPIQNGSITSWQDVIYTQNLPPMYSLEYILTANPQGTLTKSKYYSKKLTYPTLINYNYVGKSGLPAIILRIIKSNGSSVTLRDEKGDKINPQDISEEGNSVLMRFSSPQFKELNIEISESSVTPSGISGYLIIGFLVLLAFSYPIVRKKSEKLQSFEERLKDSLARKEKIESDEKIEEDKEEAEEEETTGDVDEEASEEIAPEASVEQEEEIPEDPELMGKTKDELENEKSRILSRLSKLDADYASGDLLDEEYEELSSSYNKRVEEITKRIERLG